MYARSTRFVVLLLGGALALWPATPDTNPILGTWKLNVTKSHYKPGPAPKAATRSYQVNPAGMTVILAQTLDEKGQSASVQVMANYDGKEYPVAGSSEADAITMQKTGEFTAEATVMHAGKVTATVLREISKDGKTMTITSTGMSELNPFHNVEVYEKQ